MNTYIIRYKHSPNGEICTSGPLRYNSEEELRKNLYHITIISIGKQREKPEEQLIISESLRELLGRSNCKLSKWLLTERTSITRKILAIGNHWTFRERAGMLSFCPKGKKQEYITSDTWKREGRQDIKPGRLLAQIFPLANPRDVEFFVNRFKAIETGPTHTFEYLTGRRNINMVYEKCTRSSCETKQSVGEFYANMGAGVIAMHNDAGEITGRAVLWNNVCIDGETDAKLMERIYTHNEQDATAFKVYARSQGFYFKTYQDADSRENFTRPDGTEFSDDSVKIYGDSMSACYTPYLDTFFRTSKGLSNDGSDEEEDMYVTTYNGDRILREDAVVVGDHYYSQDECVICNHDDEWILLEDAYRIELNRYNTIYIHSRYVNS